MINLSDLIIMHPEVNSFGELLTLIENEAKHGTIHLYFDV